MSSKQVLFRSKAREKVLSGATQLAAGKAFVDLFEAGIAEPAASEAL